MATSAIDRPSGIPLPPSPPYTPGKSVEGKRRHDESTFMSQLDTSSRSNTPSPSFGLATGKKKSSGVKLEDFELVRVLGKGCAGRVLLVKQTRTNTIHAMKAISKRSVFTHDELNHTLTELSILKRFATEEPNNRFVSKLHYSFTDRENLYFVMEFYPGGDLATQMEIHGVLGDHRTRFYAADITQGLEDLHRHGIIVRDLKPENILLNSAGHCVLADFGLSKEFSYRGEPQPLHVVTYPGQPTLPAWAGAGAGSLRNLPGRGSTLTSPEVVNRGEYSYAVDWWALGCIVLEGLVGRVPFHKTDDEPPIVLWEKIVADPWDEIFLQPRMTPYALDPITYSFVDGLLQKDPMWRLTEPHVKTHEYFAMLDWDTVKAGDYQDPHGLHLHPVAEYNTRYFPKLCLEENPSVDMSTHDLHDADDRKRTPLNDNQLYAIEQAKHWMELRSFTWSREEVEDIPYAVREEGNTNDDVLDIEDSCVVPKVVQEVGKESKYSTLSGNDAYSESRLDAQQVGNGLEEEHEGELSSESSGPSVEQVTDEEGSSARGSHELETEQSAQHQQGTPSLLVSPNAIQISAPIPTAREESIEEGSEGQNPSASSQRPPLSKTAPQAPVSLTPLPPSPRRQTAPVPINGLSKARPVVVTGLALHNGLPASGLSVSDTMSISSPEIGSQTRIVRRHHQRPSADTIPIVRLSVELHGTITHIEDEEWEQLAVDGPLESAPNGGNHGSIFSRGFGGVLRRKPSTLVTSGLRRQTNVSDSSKDSSSPTKALPGLFAAKGLESTKKALERLKAFPKPKLHIKGDGVGGSRSTTAVDIPRNIQLGSDEQSATRLSPHSPKNRSVRPSPARRHTESGWLDRRKKGKTSASASASEKPSRSSKASLASASARSSSDGPAGVPPRLELRDTGKVIWEFDGGEWGMKG